MIARSMLVRRHGVPLSGMPLLGIATAHAAAISGANIADVREAHGALRAICRRSSSAHFAQATPARFCVTCARRIAGVTTALLVLTAVCSMSALRYEHRHELSSQ